MRLFAQLGTENFIDDDDRLREFRLIIQECASAAGVYFELAPSSKPENQGSVDQSCIVEEEAENHEENNTMKSLVFDCAGEPVLVVLRSG